MRLKNFHLFNIYYLYNKRFKINKPKIISQDEKNVPKYGHGTLKQA
jgi:hypothetical protein